MFLFNKVLKLKFISRYREINLFKAKPLLAQEQVFFSLLKKSKDTVWGKRFNYSKIIESDFSKALKEWQDKVPVSNYEKLFPDIEPAINGELNVLWPGKIRMVAKSSGTTNSKSKSIPVTKDALKKCHYKGGEDVIALYLDQNPYSKLFIGKTLSVGGSFMTRKSSDDIFYGDLSAILINNLPWWARIFRSPKLSVALLSEWEKKVEAIALDTIPKNVVALAGVPSWTLVVLNKILEMTKKDNILEVWPNLELFIHGGVSFAPYRAQFEKIIPSKQMKYLETYNASEGFFALNDDLNRDDMLLVLDSGVFYEFIPLDELEKEKPQAKILSEVEIGKTYALAISTNGGLWRYLIGDTVKVTSLQPFRIKIAGRTKHFINVFGEELMVANADEALRLASERSSAIISEYTVAPIFMEGRSRGGHEWLIEFSKKPENLDFFIDELDKELKNLNSDYEAKRYNDLILARPKVIIAKDNLFYEWLKGKDKLGGQNKVPRLSNSREYIEELLKL
jgi:hypothetical protein